MKVSIRNLTKKFKDVVALERISLDIEEGEFFFLLGPSGCGKTTLLRLIAGFDQTDDGEIAFDGRRVNAVPPEKRNSGMVFQNYALWPHLTVWENVAFGLEVRKLSAEATRDKVQAAIEMVRMTGYEARRPAQLSGGQQQRVALARALVIEPELVLLDEPLSNLDARLRIEMRHEIREIIKKTGHTAIYVTHDQKEALSMADRCAILNHGKIIQVGAPAHLYRNPCNRFVAEFLGETNLLPGQVAQLQDNRIEIQLDGLGITLCAAKKEGFKTGDKVLCAIRPESLKRAVSPQPAVNCIQGSIADTAYLGEVTQHGVRLLDSEIRLQFLEISPRYDSGAYIELTVDMEDVILLKD